MKKAFVFDLFGTLVDVREKKANNKILGEMSAALHVDFEIFKMLWIHTYEDRMLGTFESIQDNIKYILKKQQLERSEEELTTAARMRADFVKRSLETKRVGLFETLSDIKTRGFKIGLISDCSPDVPAVWNALAYDHYFDSVIFSCKVGMKKPNPKIYQKSVDCLNVDFDECYYIGDGGSNELTGAQKVGMHPILIKSKADEIKNVYKEDADHWASERIFSLSELMNYE